VRGVPFAQGRGLLALCASPASLIVPSGGQAPRPPAGGASPPGPPAVVPLSPLAACGCIACLLMLSDRPFQITRLAVRSPGSLCQDAWLAVSVRPARRVGAADSPEGARGSSGTASLASAR